MRKKGRLSQLFCDNWHERTTSAAARNALEALVPGSSTASVPVNVEAAARFVGIEQIVEADLDGSEGLLGLTPSGKYIVSVSPRQSHVRRRFTVAHEIGHAIVFKSIGRQRDFSGNQLSCRSVTPDEADEERLCDILASELLMPRGSFLTFMSSVGVCAQTVPAIARQFDVSLQAVGRRIADLLPYEVGIGFWTLSESGSHLIPKWYVTKMRTVVPPYALAVDQAGSELFSDGPVHGWRWLPLQGPMEQYFVDIHPIPSTRPSWLLLIVFSSAAEHIWTTISKSAMPEFPDAALPLIDE